MIFTLNSAAELFEKQKKPHYEEETVTLVMFFLSKETWQTDLKGRKIFLRLKWICYHNYREKEVLSDWKATSLPKICLS